MSLQRQHFLLGYFKTLSVGPAGVWTHDLPHGSPVLYQLSQPVGDKFVHWVILVKKENANMSMKQTFNRDIVHLINNAIQSFVLRFSNLEKKVNIQSTPDNSDLQGKLKLKASSYREFELSRVKLYRKWPEGE